jgi:hypothetical protein
MPYNLDKLYEVPMQHITSHYVLCSNRRNIDNPITSDMLSKYNCTVTIGAPLIPLQSMLKKFKALNTARERFL